MKLLICEILDEVRKAPTQAARVAVLRKRDCPDLRSVLRATYHPRIRFHIDHVPYYKPYRVPRGTSGHLIASEIKRLYLFEVGNPKCPAGFTQKKRETLLIQILEALEADEATVFMNMLLKDLRVPGLDRAVVREAFPGLLDD